MNVIEFLCRMSVKKKSVFPKTAQKKKKSFLNKCKVTRDQYLLRIFFFFVTI